MFTLFLLQISCTFTFFWATFHTTLDLQKKNLKKVYCILSFVRWWTNVYETVIASYLFWERRRKEGWHSLISWVIFYYYFCLNIFTPFENSLIRTEIRIISQTNTYGLSKFGKFSCRYCLSLLNLFYSNIYFMTKCQIGSASYLFSSEHKIK